MSGTVARAAFSRSDEAASEDRASRSRARGAPLAPCKAFIHSAHATHTYIGALHTYIILRHVRSALAPRTPSPARTCAIHMLHACVRLMRENLRPNFQLLINTEHTQTLNLRTQKKHLPTVYCKQRVIRQYSTQPMAQLSRTAYSTPYLVSAKQLSAN